MVILINFTINSGRETVSRVYIRKLTTSVHHIGKENGIVSLKM